MKKTQLPLLLAFFGLALTSCDEDFTCVCINTVTGSTISNSIISADNSADAQEACDDKESIWTPDRCEIQ